jgi:hypothetical protein
MGMNFCVIMARERLPEWEQEEDGVWYTSCEVMDEGFEAKKG